MKKVIILQGLPASGKSFWAKQKIGASPNQYKRVNKDDLRDMVDDGHWSGDNEKQILRIRDALILQFLDEGKHVIVDDTNLHPKHIENITKLVKDRDDVKIETKMFDVSLDECIKRDNARQNSVGKKVILRMYNDFLKEKPLVIEYDKNLPNAIIVDIDGTLAKMVDRSPYDYSKVLTDKVNTPIVELVNLLYEQKNKIILLSGRDSVCRYDTIKWLGNIAMLNYDKLYMRPEGNKTEDSLIKRKLYEDNIKGKYNVKFVLDDRDRVVRMWRSLGLTCLQVDYGDF